MSFSKAYIELSLNFPKSFRKFIEQNWSKSRFEEKVIRKLLLSFLKAFTRVFLCSFLKLKKLSKSSLFKQTPAKSKTKSLAGIVIKSALCKLSRLSFLKHGLL